MKRHFVAGLIILLPLVITYWIFTLLVNCITTPFESLVFNIFDYFSLFTAPSSGNVHIAVLVVAKLLIIFFLFIVLVLFGYLAKRFFVRHLIAVTDKFFLLFPFVNRIYKATKEFTTAIFSPKVESFSKVVLVPYPSANHLAVGFITGQIEKNQFPNSQEDMISVLIPGTPNPTVGFALFFKRSAIIYVDVSPEEALKFVMSCGSAAPKFINKKSAQPL